MSARLDSLLDKTRLSDIARHDAEQSPLSAFKVEIIKSGNVLRSFEAMSPSSCEVVMQHADLVEPGAKMSVMRLETWRALQFQAERALDAQMQRQGVA